MIIIIIIKIIMIIIVSLIMIVIMSAHSRAEPSPV